MSTEPVHYHGDPADPEPCQADHDTEAQQEAESRRDAQALEIPPVSSGDEAALVRRMPVDVMARKLIAAERELAALRAVLLEGGQSAAMARQRALAIIGAEEKADAAVRSEAARTPGRAACEEWTRFHGSPSGFRPWEDLPERVQAAWESVAVVVLRQEARNG